MRARRESRVKLVGYKVTIGPTLVCIRRNAQHRGLKLPKSTRFALITAVMVAVPTGGPTGCLVSPPPLLSQTKQSHEESPESYRAQGVPPTISLALGANREGKERVKGKASRMQSSRIGSALVCVRRNAQHRELRLPKSTRFVLNTVLKVAVSTCGPTGVSPPPLSSQNIQSHEKSPASHRARGEPQTTSLALGANREGKERVKGVCVCARARAHVRVFIKLESTAQSGPVVPINTRNWSY